MKIALSASFYDDPDVQKELRTCDAIFTTQHNRYNELHRLFPDATIYIVPDTQPDMVALIKARWARFNEPVTWIDYQDLYALHYMGEGVSHEES